MRWGGFFGCRNKEDENKCDIREGVCYVLSPEEYPGKTDQAEGNDDVQCFPDGGKCFAPGNDVDIFPVAVTEQQWQKEQGMKSAPENKSPIGAMPQAAYQENDRDIPGGLPFAAGAAAQGNIQVIAKPAGE